MGVVRLAATDVAVLATVCVLGWQWVGRLFGSQLALFLVSAPLGSALLALALAPCLGHKPVAADDRSAGRCARLHRAVLTACVPRPMNLTERVLRSLGAVCCGTLFVMLFGFAFAQQLPQVAHLPPFCVASVGPSSNTSLYDFECLVDVPSGCFLADVTWRQSQPPPFAVTLNVMGQAVVTARIDKAKLLQSYSCSQVLCSRARVSQPLACASGESMLLTLTPPPPSVAPFVPRLQTNTVTTVSCSILLAVLCLSVWCVIAFDIAIRNQTSAPRRV